MQQGNTLPCPHTAADDLSCHLTFLSPCDGYVRELEDTCLLHSSASLTCGPRGLREVGGIQQREEPLATDTALAPGPTSWHSGLL